MSKIRKLYYFDKKSTQEMMSFLNDSATDTYINQIMFNPFLFLHHFLPLKLKFLPESFVLKEGKDVKGLITVAPAKGKHKKVEIQKLFFEENSYSVASELIQFVVSKYKAMGAPSILVKVDDYLPELLTLLVSKCGFNQISYEKLWRITDYPKSDFNKKEFRSFKNSDAQAVASLYNDSLLPHFRPLLSKETQEFKESLFQGLSYYSEYKYVIEDKNTKTVVGCITIQTLDNENYIVDITQAGWINIDINAVLSYATYQIKKRKKKFGLFVKTKRYTNVGGNYEEVFKRLGFILKETAKAGKFTVLGEFCPANSILTSHRQQL